MALDIGLQLAGVDLISKLKMEKAVTTCQAWQYWKKEGKIRERVEG